MIIDKILYKKRLYFSRLGRYLLLNKFEVTDKCIWFLVPNHNVVNGGIMSIASIYKEIKGYSKIHKSSIIASTYSYNNSEVFLKFTKFKNDMYIFDFKLTLRKLKKVNHLQLHIPELLVERFVHSFINEWLDSDRNVLLGIKNLSINILNQNDLLMPGTDCIELIKNKITRNVTMTIAHKKYATIEKRNQYKVPLHYLSAWVNLTPYNLKKYNQKENIILFSPDELSRLDIKYHLTKNDLIKIVKDAFPKYKVIVINNLTYDEYKELVGRSKFMITFGEGLDGYLLETILSGGVSFAVYNNKFFTKDYLDIPTLFESADELFTGLVNYIAKIDNEEQFEKINAISREVIEREYSYGKYQNRVKNYILGNYDFK